MARITVEDCIKLVNNQYDLVILAKERAVQLGRGATPAVDPENDKKPVIALREIGESKITAEELKESIVSKLRQIPDYEEEEELEEVDNDTFRQMYQGGLSKSEMEKSATRKFTARSPRVESRAKPIEEVIQPQSSPDEIVPSDDELEKIEEENSEIDMMNHVEGSESTEEPTSPSESINVSDVEEKGDYSLIISIILILVGIVLLIYGSDLFVKSAINIANELNIPEAIIGVSLVAFGTSLPELVVGILSAIRRKVDFALGNVLGSNIYNILGVLGVSSFFGNFSIPAVIGSEDLLFMLFVTVMILGFMFFLKRIGRTYGSIGLLLYIGYMFYIYS